MEEDGSGVEKDGLLNMADAASDFFTETVLAWEKYMILNGQMIPYPKKKDGHYIVQDGKRLFCDGYEWSQGKWKRSFRALWERFN